MARVKQAVFVRGNGSYRSIDERYVWDYFHFHPTRKLDPGVITAVYFDFPNAVRKTWKRWAPRNGHAPAGNPDETVELRKIDVGGGLKYATVLNLYDWVKEQDSGSIITFQTFTHGWEYGPSLFHEPQDWRNGTALDVPRRAEDTEFRIRDFYGENPLAGIELVKFNGSFSSDALIKLWGCSHDENYLRQVNDYLAAAKRNQTEQSKAHLRTYIGVLDSTYTGQMARALGRTVWGAPLGWGSDWAIEGTVYRRTFPPDFTQGDRWWTLRSRFEKKHEDFYRNVLKAKFDACRYVGYNAHWIDAVKRAVQDTPAAASPVRTPRDLQQELLDQVNALPV